MRQLTDDELEDVRRIMAAGNPGNLGLPAGYHGPAGGGVQKMGAAPVRSGVPTGVALAGTPKSGPT